MSAFSCKYRSIVSAILLALLGSLSLSASAQSAPSRPRLVVVLSIDQFRGDYIRRFEPFMGEGGFKRILREGFNYDNCLYPTANTETGPGHSCLLTGAYAHLTGITQNDWYDASLGRRVYCVEDTASSPVNNDGVQDAQGKGSMSPRSLLASAVGDSLETSTGGTAKTFSASLKDRAAILMGGHSADIALWFDRSLGQFVTSNFYRDALPPWVVEFNQRKAADQWFKKDWALSLAPETYAALCTPDDFPAEAAAAAGYASAVFPHTLGVKSEAPDRAYYTTLYTSPFGNDLLVELVKEAVVREEMGKDVVPDLLTLSFSSNDPIGHAFGPDSWEVMDTTIKTDASLARLLEFLDSAVGAGQWTLLLSADHGVVEFPEVLQARRIDAQRVNPKDLSEKLEAHLVQLLGPAAGGAAYISSFDVPWIVLNPAAVAPENHDRMVNAAVDWLRSDPRVALAVRSDELKHSTEPTDRLLHSLWLCYYPGRAGTVAYFLKPGYLLADSPQGTNHGTPYRYDQSVPLLAMGHGIRHGRSGDTVNPAQIAPTVALLCGVIQPNQCEVPPMAQALAQP